MNRDEGKWIDGKEIFKMKNLKISTESRDKVCIFYDGKLVDVPDLKSALKVIIELDNRRNN